MRAVRRDRLEDGRPRRETTGAAAAGKLEDSGEDDLCSLPHGVAHRELGVPSCHTGASGLAGLLQSRHDLALLAAAPDLVVLTGLER